MRKLGADPAQITPTPTGWRLHVGGAAAREAATLEELTPHIPAGTRLKFSLPFHSGLIERLTLPSLDREELAGMAQLHLEKTLPYPVEEVSTGFEVIRASETESTILIVAVHGPVLERLCQPLRDAQRLPELISFFPFDVASHCPPGKVVAAVWAEQEHLAVAIYEEGKLSWVIDLGATDAQTLQSELPANLLTAEVDGVPTNVESVVVASDCEYLREPLRELFNVPVGVFAVDAIRPTSVVNLLPPDWAAEAARLGRAERIKQRVLLAAVVYLLLVACAFVYLAWTKRSLQVIDAQIARTQPAMVATQERQSRWLALAPALDPSRYAVEVIYLVNKNRPNDVSITLFDYTPAQFLVEGEAPNAGLAIDFAERLRADKELGFYNIEGGPPQILPNQHAKFRIFGRL